ncbi:sodium-dependent transporter [Endozoicomonas sp. OPT23]|uniref:sodium-dependent transporter n=1 Tax=Endozoicomonas sp. OPT23 TaxID=2072845 RepID=UPI00129AD8BB|nr:sodium-dependent transporter [Endozoicomonas sp. OPT23]MRI32729.1 sodium-dependent transporter [Endozoicomonas sp. OPT23]
MPSDTSTASPIRTGFSSRLGFVLAAAGSAVGLGNIWSFPTQVAENGGAAFVLVYLLLSLGLAYPVLVAELMIGRYQQRDPVTALEQLSNKPSTQLFTRITGITAVFFVCLIFCFYSIVSGWLLGFTLSPIIRTLGLDGISQWLTSFSPSSNWFLATLFIALTYSVVVGGVKKGIERWSSRLMPLLILLLVGLILSMLKQDGAMVGLQHYLLPDFNRINGQLVMSALGQSFFSMSLGVGVMIVYGSYLNRGANLPVTALQVCLMDTGIAFLAGLLIVPALFVAQHSGITIFTADGLLISSDTLVFQVLPALFNNMGISGSIVALAFFTLMTIAALTSSISMLEAPVASLTERLGMTRRNATLVISVMVMLLTTIVVFNFEQLFSLIVTLTTQYAQPINSLLFCLFAGWLIGRNEKLKEIRNGWPEAEHSLFWKIWPWYIKVVCPVLITAIIVYSFSS